MLAEHGNVPVVQDLTTGWWMPASAVRLGAPPGGDPEVRQQQHLWLVQQQVRDDTARTYSRSGGLVVHLTVIERVVMWWRGDDPRDWEMEAMRARMAVAARTAQRRTTATNRHWPPTVSLVRQTPKRRREVPTYDYAETWLNPEVFPAQRRNEPAPVDLDKVAAASASGTAGGTTVAGTVNTFSDLESPDVHPFEYPDELPGHLAQVAALFNENGDELDQEVDALRGKTTSVERYVEYMRQAQVVPNVVSPLEEAHEAYLLATEMMQQARAAVSAAAEAAEAARVAAEAVYGDNEVPRFDQAG